MLAGDRKSGQGWAKWTKVLDKNLIRNLQGPKLAAKMMQHWLKDQDSHLEVLPLERPDDLCPPTVSIQRISGYLQNPGELTCKLT